MSLFHSLNISASALTASRLRMDVISSNVANAETTRASLVNGEWMPYQRKMVHVTPGGVTPFRSLLDQAMGRASTQIAGVEVEKISVDKTPFKTVFDPTHPDADQEGYVRLPNVDILKETVDMMSATRTYEANVTTLNASKNMFAKALEIGR